jgi:hypothetical protein
MANPWVSGIRLSHQLCSVVVLLGVACGGASESASQSGGGSSAGGTSGNGHSSGGTSGNAHSSGGTVGDAAGASNGGSNSGGVGGYNSNAGGSLGLAGSLIIVGGSGVGGSGVGGATVDERCPGHLPTATLCTADDAGAICQYDVVTGCLCYTSPSGTFLPCQQVDPTCSNSGVAGQSSAGAGGSVAKIPLPPRQLCSCSASSWMCSYGI